MQQLLPSQVIEEAFLLHGALVFYHFDNLLRKKMASLFSFDHIMKCLVGQAINFMILLKEIKIS